MTKVLHAGCGPTEPLPPLFQELFGDDIEEVRLDVDPDTKPDIVASILNLGDIGPFHVVYASHVIEHLYPHEVPIALREFRRVLAEDGFALIFVPDLEGLKVTREAVRRVMREHPELLFGAPEKYSVDLFHHGAHKGAWFGEDYAFSRRWNDLGGEIWIVPNLNLDHHSGPCGARAMPARVYKGNFHKFLLRCAGGSEAPK